MRQKQLFIATGFWLLLSSVGGVLLHATQPRFDPPFLINFDTKQTLAIGKPLTVYYSIQAQREGIYGIQPNVELSIIQFVEVIKKIEGPLEYTLKNDTLNIVHQEVTLNDELFYSGEFEIILPDVKVSGIELRVKSGKVQWSEPLIFSNIEGKVFHSRQEITFDHIAKPKYDNPNTDSLSATELQTEYEVAIDLRDRSKAAEATRILGKIPANKELVKHPGGYRIKTSLSNLIQLAKAGIQFAYITAPPWIRHTQLIKDSTEIQTKEDRDN